MAFFLSFLAGVILFHSFHYFPLTSSLISVLSLILLIFRKKYLLIPVIAIGIFYAFFRYAPEADFSHIRGKEMIVSGTFNSEAVETSSVKDSPERKKFMQTFHLSSAVVTEANSPFPSLVKGSVVGLPGKDITIISDAEFEIGRRYEMTVKVTRDTTRFSPGAIKNDNLYANLIWARDFEKGKKTLWSIFQNARAGLDRYITENFDADSGALISAITTGQRGYMSEELRDDFNSTGLAHILSISGTHFGLFSVLLFGMFRFLIKYLPYRALQRITIYITPSQGSAVLCLPFMFAYLALSGWSIPAVRSFIMISLFLVGLLIGRKGFWLNSLLFAAFVIVLWSPDALFSLSFHLSFLAVLFIGFSIGYMEDKESKEAGKSGSTGDKRLFLRFFTSGLHIFRASLLLTLAASLGTAPLVAYYFHYFSIISPLANLFITPLIGFVLLPLSLFSSFIFLFTGHYVFSNVIKMVADLTVYLVMNTARFPFVDVKIPAFQAIIVICFYAGVAAYFISNKKRDLSPSPTSPPIKGGANAPQPLLKLRGGEEGVKFPLPLWERVRVRGRLICLIIILVILMTYLSLTIFWKNYDISITYLDVGQGDASVLELPDKKTIVIDTGRGGREVAAFLKYRGRKTIDALVLSHAHPDHTGGVDYLIKHFKVKELWDNGRLIYPEGTLEKINPALLTESARVNHRALERGDVMEGKGYKIYAFHPYKEFYTMNGDDYNEENNSSLVIKIEGERESFLFSGDVEEEAEEDIAHLYKWLDSSVIKVPHHGGKTSGSRGFFDAVSPEIAVISAGRDNVFGHPHHEMLEILGNAKVYRTDRDGAVKITERDDYLEVKTYRDFQFIKTKNLEGEIRNMKRLFEVW